MIKAGTAPNHFYQRIYVSYLLSYDQQFYVRDISEENKHNTNCFIRILFLVTLWWCMRSSFVPKYVYQRTIVSLPVYQMNDRMCSGTAADESCSSHASCRTPKTRERKIESRTTWPICLISGPRGPSFTKLASQTNTHSERDEDFPENWVDCRRFNNNGWNTNVVWFSTLSKSIAPIMAVNCFIYFKNLQDLQKYFCIFRL